MNKRMSVASLYPLALAEGEGVGTAYEYLAKRLVLAPWLEEGARPRKIIIAGLPAKYGCSLDFALLADEFGAEVTVVDERPDALEKFARSLQQSQAKGYLSALSWQSKVTEDISDMPMVGVGFDLALSSEVLQRVNRRERRRYIDNLRRVTSRMAVFCPNADNPAHIDRSGLSGLTREELSELGGHSMFRSGFVDMPPFPPGMTRTDEQREQAATGRIEALAMAGLAGYVRLERFIPERIRRKQSHIVFAVSRAT